MDAPDPDRPEFVLESEILESQPLVVQGLLDEGFRTVRVSAGDSVSVALSDRGELRAWGSFRVSSACGFLITVVLISCASLPTACWLDE